MHCMWCSGIQAQSQDTFSCADQDIVCLQPSNHHEDMDLAKILTTKWSRENYAILWIQNQNIQFMCFTREVSIVKDLSKFLPWNIQNYKSLVPDQHWGIWRSCRSNWAITSQRNTSFWHILVRVLLLVLVVKKGKTKPTPYPLTWTELLDLEWSVTVSKYVKLQRRDYEN